MKSVYDEHSQRLNMDDLMEQIRQLALWVSEPGAKRTIQVSS